MSPSPFSQPDGLTTPVRKRVLVALSPYERTHLLADRLEELKTLPHTEVSIVVCAQDTPGDWEQCLRRFRPEVLVAGWAAPALPATYLAETDCPLRYVCVLTGTVRRLVPRHFIQQGGLVTNWGDNAAPMVAEQALLLLLASLRCLSDWKPFHNLPIDEQTRDPIRLPTQTLFGRRVCVHGFGRVARQFIRLLAPFGTPVRAYSHGVPDDYIRAHDAEPVGSLAELFEGAEIVVECEALTPQTRGSVDRAIIARLAPGAVFVNVGRGAVVDEAALAERARAQEIRVALDVLAVEPLPFDSPLRDIAGAIISPHIGGPTRDRLPELGARAIANLRQYLDGQIPADLVSTDEYDRAT